ncbi:MAG: leucine-rich repeat protein, partial [Oscillospiraceae bacterium]|nr:leucine-rich repeat protein [Oscillospiraceae bacterium]
QEENPVFAPSVNIYLPQSYKGKPVTSIGNRAFNTNNFDYITGTVNIPSSITSIGSYAFWMCNFTDCNIPESVTSIGTQAFDDTPWLDNMRKQNPVVIVNNILVDAKTVSGDVVLPDTLTRIPRNSFYENELVTSVTIPNSVTVIEPYAFYKCSSLEKVNIPESITEIGEWTFGHCKKLGGALTIPSNIKTIGNAAFWSCQELTAVNIQNGVAYIGDNAFKFCTSVVDVSIPDSVKTIGEFAFSENHKLNNIVIPAGVDLIGQGCFRYDYTLDSVKIMNSKCEIYDADDTFPSLTVIYGYENSTAHNYAKKYDRKFESLGESPAPNGIIGDVNGDATVDSSDAAAVLVDYSFTSTGKSSTLTDAQKAAADIDKDGKIDSS